MARLSPLGALFTAQFLSAFVDNMILFVALAIIRRDAISRLLPAVRAEHFFRGVYRAVAVGRAVSPISTAKARVLITGNAVKAAGVADDAGWALDPALRLRGGGGGGGGLQSRLSTASCHFLTRGEDELLAGQLGAGELHDSSLSSPARWRGGWSCRLYPIDRWALLACIALLRGVDRA